MVDRTGQQLGNYRLLKLLEESDDASVYLGEHIHLKTLAAIKVPQVRLLQDDQQSFLQQVRAIAGLAHPNVVRVLECGVAENTPYLVMTYARGGTLRQRHPIGTQVPLPLVVTYVRQLAAALQYAHDRGLVHRDIRPEHMLLGRNNEVLLSNFGVALPASHSRTQSVQELIGAVTYMAPERVQGSATAASDQYALAVVVYEWLCGIWPFYGNDYLEIATQQLRVMPAPLSSRLPTLPVGVESVVMKALAKDAAQRFENVQAFAWALEQAMLTPVSGISRSQPPVSASSPITDPSKELAARRPTRRAVAIGLIAFAGVTAAGGGIALLMLPQQKPPALPPTPTVPPAAPGTTLYTYRGHVDNVIAVAWSPDGARIASWSDDDTMQECDAATGHLLVSYPVAKILSWTPDWQRLATGNRIEFQAWDFTSGRTIFSQRGAVTASGISYELPANTLVAYSPDGKRIVSLLGSSVQAWDGNSGKNILTYSSGPPGGGAAYLSAVAWSPDSKRIAVATSAYSSGKLQAVQVVVIDVAGASMVLSYHLHGNVIQALAWSPDGKLLASAGDEVQVREASTGKMLVSFQASGANGLAWSPDSTLLATYDYSLDPRAGPGSPVINIWYAASGGKVLSYSGHTGGVNYVAWSPDGRRIASASADKTVKVWQVR